VIGPGRHRFGVDPGGIQSADIRGD